MGQNYCSYSKLGWPIIKKTNLASKIEPELLTPYYCPYSYVDFIAAIMYMYIYIYTVLYNIKMCIYTYLSNVYKKKHNSNKNNNDKNNVYIKINLQMYKYTYICTQSHTYVPINK